MCSNGGGAILESYNFSGKIDGLCKVGVGHRHEQPILIVFYFWVLSHPIFGFVLAFLWMSQVRPLLGACGHIHKELPKVMQLFEALESDSEVVSEFVTPFHPMVNNIIFPLASPEKTRAYPPRQIRVRLLFTHPIVCTISTYADYFVSRWFMKCIAFCGTTPCRRVSSLKFCLAAGGTSWSTAWRMWRCFWPQP